METRVLHLGCMIFNRFQDYEISAISVLEGVGIRVKPMHRFACCSSTLIPSVSDEWIYLATYNLALAEELGLDVITLCGTCTSVFKRANYLLRDEELLKKVNHRLEEVGLKYSGKTKVEHILEVLVKRKDKLADSIKRSLNIKVALQHPCNVFRPSYIANFDNPFEPRALKEILSLTGVEIVHYSKEYDCCGSTLVLVEESLGYLAGAEKLISAQEAGAEYIAVGCGNCTFLFDRKLEELKKLKPELKIKTLFFTQLLALAMEREAALDVRGIEVEL